MNLKELPQTEQPYEKLWQLGPSALSDAELLAIILRTGGKGKSAITLSQEILSTDQKNLLNLYEKSAEELTQISGIGRVKAIQLKAISEISKRIAKETYHSGLCFNKPETIADYYMEQMRHSAREFVIAAYFDIRNNLISEKIFDSGAVTYSFFPLQEILKKGLLCDCVGIVILHNHPSGNPAPSSDDLRVTKALAEAAELLQMKVLDHIIIGDRIYFSFLEQNLI